MIARPSWDDTFLEMCGVIAKRSKDQNTKVGCVIVGRDHEIRTVGYNCFPRGLKDDLPERQERPLKYAFIEHAERNAIYNAAREGVALKDCVCYIPGLPCGDCARGLIQCKITEVVCGSNVIPERWRASCEPALTMLEEAGVKIRLPNTTDRLTLQIGSEWGTA
jgi:dCMP deaminase